MLSNQLRRMTKGYKSEASQQGYQPRAAEPIHSGKVRALLEILMHQQQFAAGVDRLLLIRDGLIVSLLWQPTFRGFNVGALRLNKDCDPNQQPSSSFYCAQR